MGMTIHYSFETETKNPKKVKKIIRELHNFAMDLPFEKVGDIIHLKGDECDKTKNKRDDLFWILTNAEDFRKTKDGTAYVSFPPSEIIAFEADPAKGTEWAEFGLARFENKWKWKAFCKTQYATKYGIENFLHGHLLVITMLDKAKELGILKEVYDEGGYYEKRNVQELVKEVGEWNQFVAAFSGMLKDLSPPQFRIESEIFGFENFEYLEFKGQKYLKNFKKEWNF